MLKIVIGASCFYYLLIVLQKNYITFRLIKQNRVTIRQEQQYFLVIFAVPFIIRR